MRLHSLLSIVVSTTGLRRLIYTVDNGRWTEATRNRN